MHKKHDPGIALCSPSKRRTESIRLTHGGRAITVRTSRDGSSPAVIVTDRDSIERGLSVARPYVVISIHDPGTPPARVVQGPNLLGVLHLAFHDTRPIKGVTLPPQAVPMIPEHAEAIWRFVQEHRQAAGAIVVHCEHGMSRSPAVAAAICQTLGGDPARFFRECCPNMHVHRLVLEGAKIIEEVV